MNARCEHPQVLWLAAAAVPALAGFLFWSWRVKTKLALQFVHARLLSSLTVGVSAAREKVRMALLVAALAGILLALARPQWGFAWEEAHLRGMDIIVALDTSRSMLARDVSPNRLERAKLAAIDLMRLTKTDRLGLVVFAGAGFLQAPLTLDDQAFQQSVNAVFVGIVPQGGTSLCSAIRTSLAAFEKGNDNHKVMVLFTDGEDHDADAETLAATKEAAEAGLRIFTIGVGTPEGELLRVTDEQGNASFVKDDEGNVVKSRLNQTLLQQIATEAHGFYLPLRGANPMETLYSRGLAPLPKTEETTRLTRVYQERYHWFLGFAVFCLVIEALLPERPGSRRSRSAAAQATVPQAAVTLALLLLLPLAGRASPSSAFRDYQSGNFKDAFEEYSRLAQKKTNDYRLRYDAGTAAYKARQLDAAQKQFNATLDTPDIISAPQNQQRTYYNLGNTLYRLGEPLPDPDKKKELWQHAIKNYDLALRLNTNDLDARNNLAYVKQQLEELKRQQQQQQQQQKEQQDKDQKEQKDQQNQQQQQQDKDQKNQQNQQQQQQDQKTAQQKKDEEKARQEQAKKDQEKKEQQAQASPAGQKDAKDENSEAGAEAQQRMSLEEARQLLEAQKDDAKMLLFSPENQPVKTPPAKIKDW
jgi:Ca-activated chloride channel family protein